jgi:FMN phosphatase YigB (HAD superfamily)
VTRLRIGFDLDGTLLDSPYGRLWFRPWVAQREAQEGLTPGTLLARLRAEGTRRWRQGRWAAAYDWADITAAVIGTPIPDPPVPPPEAIWPLVLPGVVPLLAWLWDRGVELVLVTNGFWAWQSPYLKALGWDRLFVRHASPDLGYAKPDPRLFDAVGPLDGFVGDRPWHDVLGARRAGVRVALVGPGPAYEDRWDPLGRVPVPDLAVRNLTELRTRWAARGLTAARTEWPSRDAPWGRATRAGAPATAYCGRSPSLPTPSSTPPAQ